MDSVLERELVVVTGKGGVGRSTISAALAVAAAGPTSSVVVCETAGQTAIPELFGHPPPPPGSSVGLSDGLAAMTIDSEDALREWVGSQVGGTLSRVLGSSRSFGQFTTATPGLRELLTITKAWELGHGRGWTKNSPSFGTVVLDAPATGHGVALLRSPRTFADLAAAGPIHSDAMKVWDLVCDPKRTAIIAVSLPAELPVAETIDLDHWLRETLGRPLDAVIVNRCEPQRFTPAETALIARAVEAGTLPPAAGTVAAANLAKSDLQAPLIDELMGSVDAAPVSVPEYAADVPVREMIDSIAMLLTAGLSASS